MLRARDCLNDGVWGRRDPKETAVSEYTTAMTGLMIDPVIGEVIELTEWLLAEAKEQGTKLVGPAGLLNQLTRCSRPCWKSISDEHGQTPDGVSRGVSLGDVVVARAGNRFPALWLSAGWQGANLARKRMWLECFTHFAFRGC